MINVIIKDNKIVSCIDYEPNLSGEDVEVIRYEGTVPREFLILIGGELKDSRNYILQNDEYILKTEEIENQLNINKEARQFLAGTDWKVIRHRDQLELQIEISLTNDEYIELLQQRQEARSRVVEVL